MDKIEIRKIIESKLPGLFSKYPEFFSNAVIKFLTKSLKVKEINSFYNHANDLFGFDFLDELFHHLDFSFYVMSKEKDRIPSEGRLVVVANHPLGGLDGLAIVKAIAEVRKDVRIVANDLLMNLDNLAELFLPYDVYAKTPQKTNISKIIEALNNEEVVVFFPAGEVSRLSISGIVDRPWLAGASKLALKCKAPVLPLYVKARNSIPFYLLSLIYRKIGTFLLPSELFKKKHQNITFRIGRVIPSDVIAKFKQNPEELTTLLKKHTYNIGRDKPEILQTETTVIHPVDLRLILKEFENNRIIGYTKDKKIIYLVDSKISPYVMREVTRLRELTFRKVSEGTYGYRDYDKYDLYYNHIVLWDEKNNEIVGSYRLGLVKEIIDKYGKEGLITSRKYIFHEKFNNYLGTSLEVGRSFIQEKYWGTAALDYMWQGIGAFLNDYPHIKYLWGTVSMSESYPELAKQLVVYYYEKWYKGDIELATPFIAYQLTEEQKAGVSQVFTGSNHSEDFRILKQKVKELGFTVPVLYRRYAEICEYGGVDFINFSIDTKFNNSIDGLILVDLTKLKIDVKQRYYTKQRSFSNAEEMKI